MSVQYASCRYIAHIAFMLHSVLPPQFCDLVGALFNGNIGPLGGAVTTL